MIYTADELFNKLKTEDSEEYVYRGQDRAYPPPLWPSNYRPYRFFPEPLEIEQKHSFRNCGGKFYFKTPELARSSYQSEEQFESYSKDFYLREYLKAHIRNALGYPFSEAVFQQTGLRSEGLDVTRSIPVALFFAAYQFYDNAYHQKTSEEPSVIYRWRVPRHNWDLKDLNAYDLTNCPVLIPSVDVLSTFGDAEHIEAFLDSLDEYRTEIGWRWWDFNLASVQGSRPFGTLKFPKQAVEESRVFNQDACLLLPDMLHPQMSAELFPESRNNFNGKMPPVMLVSDQSSYLSCEIFQFSMKGIDRIGEMKDLIPEKIFPSSDVLFTVLRSWLSTFFENPFGTPIIIIDPEFLRIGMSSEEFMRKMDRMLEERFFI